MKIIYQIHACYGTYFLKENGDLITYIHENDGEWRQEYFAPILRHLDAEIITINVPEMKQYPEIDDYWEYYEQNFHNIKKKIKSQSKNKL